MAVDLGDYNDVAARIAEFRAKHPAGTLQPADPTRPYTIEQLGDQTYIVVVAAAYRSPDDPRPGIGMAYEQFPGRTSYTRGSELQNAETSAWGRAIVAALAADTRKGIASADEVRNRRAEQDQPAQPNGHVSPPSNGNGNGHRPNRGREDLVATGVRAILDADTPEQLQAIAERVNAYLDEGRITAADAEELLANLDARMSTLPTGPITPEQVKRLHTLFSVSDIRDRDDKLRFCSEVLDRVVDSTKNLTKAEASAVMDTIEKALAEPTEMVPA